MSGRSKFEGFPKLITELDWAKMAVSLDMEGCIRIQSGDFSKYHKHAVSIQHSLQLRMGNTDPRLALWCYERFGGGLYHREISKRNPKHRDFFDWFATSKRAEAILHGCMPHFIIKREQADTALAFCDIAWTQMRGQRLPQEIIEQREFLKRKLEEQKVQRFEVIDGFRKMA